MQINFFVRKKYPEFFSIEQIFTALRDNITQRNADNVKAEIREVPYFFSPLNFFRNIFYVKKQQADINHITGDIHYAILGCSNKNLNVLTIHDCVLLEKHSKWDPRYWIFRMLWYDLPMRKADLITVISAKTKQELISKVGYGEKKIRVVRNFVNNIFEYSPGVFNKEKPTLLFIGSTPNKNLHKVLEAIKGINCRLQIVGKILPENQSYIIENGIEVEISFELSLSELAEKYRHCDLVLFPSLYEGFGMLIIEANAIGRPVLTSNLSPMLEIAGNAAAIVDPFNIESIRNGIIRVIEDDNYRESLIVEGLANAKKYTLNSVAENYLQLYREFEKDAIK